MSETPLLDIARDWSHWTEPPPRSVPRSVQVPKAFRPDIALVVQGVRRCGKSTLLKQLMDRYALDRTKCLFINFEDPRLSGSLNHQCLQSLVDAFEADRGAGCTYFLDEIQGVAGWERWLRSQLDRPGKRRFAVTGSNAHLLSGELGSVLTGRHHTVELFPFDLAEYRALRPRCTLTEYLTNGGFPATVASPDHAMMLRNYFQDIVERDVRSRVGARSSAPLRQLAQMLFEGAGSETSMRRIAAALDVSIDTAGLYTQAISDAYMCFPCEFHAWSERKRLVRNRKYYPVDPGLRRACVTPTGADLGKALECAVFTLLRNRFGQVRYWRGDGEVDFVVERDGNPIPVQVTWDAPQERHMKATDAFIREHRGALEPVFVTADSFERGIPELAPRV
jgi:predicted AAA+ superfamily ATPase